MAAAGDSALTAAVVRELIRVLIVLEFSKKKSAVQYRAAQHNTRQCRTVHREIFLLSKHHSLMIYSDLKSRQNTKKIVCVTILEFEQ
jgi:hypothetical protein